MEQAKLEPNQAECNCGQLARLAEDPTNSIAFDARFNEYHIVRKDNSGYSPVCFCPFCGGRAPKSERGKLVQQGKPMLIQQKHELHAVPGAQPLEPQPQIDTQKRYDVYCLEPSRQNVVYRNARFKGAAALLPHPGGRMHHPDYVELEQANGQSIFIPRSSIFRFCEPGTAVTGEGITTDKP
jgi:hypothetical protein